jgi:exopolysaccharide production protein ExoQ
LRGLAAIRDVVLFSFLIIIFSGNFTRLPFYIAPPDLSFDPYRTSQGSLLGQLILIAFFLVGFVLQLYTPRPSGKIIKSLAPLFFILLWMLLSITWSDFPDISMRRAIRFLMEVISLVCFAAAYPDQYRILRIIFLSFGLMVLIDIVLLAFPEVSYTSIGYAGMHEDKNQTGMFCFFALPVFLLALFDRRIFRTLPISLGVAASCLVILVLSLCKTAWTLIPVCLLVTFALFLLPQLSPTSAVAGLVVGGFGSTIGLLLVVNFGIFRLIDYIFKDPTLTGRDRLWDYTLYKFSQSPLVGHGYGALWETGRESYIGPQQFGVNFMVNQAHNGYLDILAQLGIVGLILTTLFLLVTLFRLVRLVADARGPIMFIAIYTTIGIIMYNTTESSLLRSSSGIWLYFILVVSSALMTRAPSGNDRYGASGSKQQGTRSTITR